MYNLQRRFLWDGRVDPTLLFCCQVLLDGTALGSTHFGFQHLPSGSMRLFPVYSFPLSKYDLLSSILSISLPSFLPFFLTSFHPPFIHYLSANLISHTSRKKKTTRTRLHILGAADLITVLSQVFFSQHVSDARRGWGLDEDVSGWVTSRKTVVSLED